MNRRLLLVIIAIGAILLGAIFFNLKKIALSLEGKEGKTSVAIANLLPKAKEAEAMGNLLAAKATYQQLINDFSNSEQVTGWQNKIEDLNIRLLFSALVTPKSVSYEIRPGDTLIKIAREFKITPELIKKSNALADDTILPGRKIKVWNAPFSIVVDKSQNTLLLKSEEEVIKTYSVSTGANNSTPVGNFKIVNKIFNPTWFKAGAVVPPDSPENILGSCWLGFNLSGYGIHGTTDPQNIGKQVTQGCVRMSNPDVEELYVIVPAGTEVTIVD